MSERRSQAAWEAMQLLELGMQRHRVAYAEMESRAERLRSDLIRAMEVGDAGYLDALRDVGEATVELVGQVRECATGLIIWADGVDVLSGVGGVDV